MSLYGYAYCFGKNNHHIDASASAYLTAAGISNDGTIYYLGTSQQRTGAQIWSYVNTYFISLKSTALYDKALAIYPFIGGTATSNKWNAKSPLDADTSFRLTYTDTPTQNQLGITFDGINDRADTKIIPIADGFEYITGMSFAFYSATSQVNAQYVMGAFRRGYYYSEATLQLIGLGANYDTYNGAVNIQGHHIINRAVSSADVRYLKNNSVIGTKTRAFDYFDDRKFLIGAVLDEDNVTYAYCNGSINIGLLWIGEGLTTTEETNLDTINRALLTSLGR